MLDRKQREINAFLNKVSEILDISEKQREDADKRYTSIGEWLGREESILHDFQPSMYPQGSFLLGTVIRPLSEKDEFDVDLVCEVKVSKERNSQKVLKDAVGLEVKSYNKANNFNRPAKEGKRCWTLEYSESAKFHMDVLPAVPDGARMKAALESMGFDTSSQTDKAIAITDNTLPNYATKDTPWPVSNPLGYAEWFKSRMEVQFQVGLEMLAEARKADVKSIPDYAVKTPLQRAVQLLKRHRDIMFQNDWDNKPISIIITTLAAMAYNNEGNLLEALSSILHGMESHIKEVNGQAVISNPVNPAENFADKWLSNPKLKENFYAWLRRVKYDFEFSFMTSDMKSLAQHLEGKLGQSPVFESLRNYEDSQNGIIGAVPVGISMILENMRTWLLPKYKVRHRREPEWPSLLYRNVTIRGEIQIDGAWKPITCSTHGLPKDCSLRFFAETDTVKPYQVYWQIVNTGDDARRNKCLRGEFNKGAAGVGGLKWTEATLYTGIHWVECFVVKDGTLVARSSPLEVNIA
ncbi:nucleotidyltransferase [Desulfovibrio sulfodismutans]|uniref:Cyclic GMP-AMP synthase n=1 Tax=Desulfolutivibrio sulfodismutans TaxID=63561 RepID=A0A7K3NHT2_9BACT|nr:nucleotidyltransferase [Desulfolutivibrio sulfodismutans]NDY55647.1 nucleotidyltransferase [Desulfolutivibrio sulfodismutans]QLA11655.1 hypothetical protein GD606_04880 [Desulfolutivibrio sulfodismutans DSM 3696]